MENKDTKILKIDGSLFFGTASVLDRKIDKINPKTKFIVLDCLNVAFMDISAIFMIEDIIQRSKQKNIQTILLLKHADKRKVLKVDENDVFKKTKIYNNLEPAVNFIQEIDFKEHNIKS